MEVHRLQGLALGSGAVTEADVFKGDGAVTDFLDRVFRAGKVGNFLQDLIAAAHGSAAHGQHDKDHAQHHQGGQNLGGVGEHGAELTGGQAQIGIVARGHDHMGADPGNGDHTGIHTGLHHRVIEGQELFCPGEIPVDGTGDPGELFGFLLFPDEGLDHTDAVDIFLHHAVEVVVAFEHPLKDLVHPGHHDDQTDGKQRNGYTVDQAQPDADAHGHDQGQHQHHGGADKHPDHHLEGHLQPGHIGSQTGDDGRGGKLVDVGKAVVLDVVIHIVTQVFGKAGAGFGGKDSRGAAEAQRRDGTQYQLYGLTDHRLHILHHDAVVIELGHDQRDGDLHGHLANHSQGAEYGRPFIFPDAPGQSFQHGISPPWGDGQAETAAQIHNRTVRTFHEPLSFFFRAVLDPSSGAGHGCGIRTVFRADTPKSFIYCKL